jgi:type IV pilus assembly protein PilC
MFSFQKKFSLFSRISDQERMLFAKHLALMSRSGISLAESIEVLIQQTRSGTFKSILQGVLKDLENGQSLSKSLARYPEVFDPFFTNLIEIGESTGNFSKNLSYLAEQLERDHAFRVKLRGAMLYPAIVLSLAVVVGIGVSVFALPQLINIFDSFNVPLPLNTQILIWFATLMRDYGLIILGVLLALIVVFRILIKTSKIQIVWERFLLKLPVIGPIIEGTQLTFMCRNLGVMLQGGVPVTAALDIQTRNTENLVYRNYIKGIREAIGKGRTIASQFSLKGYSNLPPIVVKMIVVGEKTGKLDESFVYLGDFFEAQVDELTSTIATVLEPVLIFIIAGIVAFVALSIITPIYQLTGSINSGS